MTNWQERAEKAEAQLAKAQAVVEAAQEVIKFRHGEGRYNFRYLSGYDAANEYHDKWQEIELMITSALSAFDQKEGGDA